jgi:8-oxo-dGTP pyrophosphatase MutT (NUDIX family)
MEIVALYNEYDEPLHQSKPRDQLRDIDAYFRVVHVWLAAPSGGFLIQKRNKPDDPIPYQCATTSGIPDIGETPWDAALREVEEELGLIIQEKPLLMKKVITSSGKYKTITYVYVVAYDQTQHHRLNPQEVQSIKLARLKDIKAMIKRKEFWDYPTLLADPDYFDDLEVYG